MFSIKNKVIVITGGNGLLGRQMVKTFEDEGAIVFAADIYFEEQGEQNIIMDITNEASVKSGLELILKKNQHIDGWVNNAYPRTKDWAEKIENISMESWRSNVDMHLNGYFLCCKYILEQMKLPQMMM